jgi:hypothetical protein
MLEQDDGLRTWRIAELPANNKHIAATSLGLHRSAYLDYEGPLSGNRGEVMRWDQGIYSEMTEANGVLKALINGKMLRGRIEMALREELNWDFVYWDD